MRDLSDEFKLSVRSIAEVFAALSDLVSRLAVAGTVRFRGRRPTRAAVVNAALLYLDSLSPVEREHALTTGMRRLEELLAGGQAPRPGEVPATAPAERPRRVQLKVGDATPPASAKPVRRKQGG